MGTERTPDPGTGHHLHPVSLLQLDGGPGPVPAPALLHQAGPLRVPEDHPGAVPRAAVAVLGQGQGGGAPEAGGPGARDPHDGVRAHLPCVFAHAPNQPRTLRPGYTLYR